MPQSTETSRVWQLCVEHWLLVSSLTFVLFFDLLLSLFTCFAWTSSSSFSFVFSSSSSLVSSLSFHHDVFDTLLLTLARVLLLLCGFTLALNAAFPDYERLLEEKKSRVREERRARREKREKKREKKRKREDAFEKMSLNSLRVDLLHEERREKEVEEEEQKEEKEEKQTSNGHASLLSSSVSSSSSASSDAEEGRRKGAAAEEEEDDDAEDLEPLPEIPQQLKEDDKHELHARCAQRRSIARAVFFVFCTAFQVYVGIKVVSFSFRRDDEALIATLMALPIACINLEQYLALKLLTLFTQEKGVLFKTLHPHRLRFDQQAYQHGCDLCRKRISRSYRCEACDFDLCEVCFRRRDRRTAENVLRGDKGARDEEEITSTAYFFRAMRLARPHLALVSIAVVCLLVNAAAQLFSPNLQGRVIDSVIAGAQAQSSGDLAAKSTASSAFVATIEIFIAVSVINGVFGSIKSYAFSVIGARISCDIRNQLFAAIIRQDIAFFDSYSIGELTSRLSRDAEAMVSPISSVLASSLSNVLILIGGLLAIFFTSWKLSVLALTSIVPIVTVTKVYAAYSRKINKLYFAALADASSAAYQAISNIRTVRSFGTEDVENKKFKAAVDDSYSKQILDARASALSTTITSNLDLAISVLILLIGGTLVINGSGSEDSDDPLTVGKLIAFNLYWNSLNSAYNALNSLLNQFVRASSAAQKVIALSDSMPDIVTVDDTKSHGHAINGEIRIRNLSFSYQSRPDTVVLKDLDLYIPAGSTCAIVGKSGGGKSTLISLLLRFYEVHSGSIEYDSVPIENWPLKQLRRSMSTVLQETQLMNTTILENIVYGLSPDEYDREAVIEAAKAANAWEFISAMEEGLDSRLGERGQRISGGQRQRLAIARAFLRRSKLLLLDEATSALDTVSESLVQEALDRLMSTTKCTVIIVAHRLSTIMNAHQILVIDGGKILERGTHEELLQMNGVYYTLVKRQLKQKAQLIEEEEQDTAISQLAKSASKAIVPSDQTSTPSRP